MPTDQKVRIVVICDQLSRMFRPDRLFKDHGIDVDCRFFNSFVDGVECVRSWAAEGHKTDIISVDFNNFENDLIPEEEIDGRWISNGIECAELLQDWAETVSSDLKP